MNKKEHKYAANNAFLERVMLVFFSIGTAFLSTAYLWDHFAGRWFDTAMSEPAMHQYSLTFSLILHLPAWISLALGFGALSGGGIVLILKTFYLVVCTRCQHSCRRVVQREAEYHEAKK